MLIVYLLLLIPLLLIAQFDFPSADDFSMALSARLAFAESGSVIAAIAAAIRKTYTLYMTWTGYYTSSLLTTISAATFGTEWYGINAIVVLVVLHISTGIFLYVLLERSLGMNRYARQCVTVAAWFLMVQMMPEGNARVEAFYWYSGAGNYTLTFSVMLLYISFLLLSEGAKTKGKRNFFRILACISGFLAGGANYMSALTGAVLTATLIILLVMNRTGKISSWLPEQHIFRCVTWNGRMLVPMLCMLTGFLLNCAAPGNTVRGASSDGFGAGKAIAVSLWATLRYPLDEWMNWSWILLLLMLAILFWKTTGETFRKGRVTFRHPIILAVFAYGIVSANVTPCYYAIGNIDAGRIQALFWMQFILASILTLWYLTGWLRFGRISPSGACAPSSSDESAAGQAAFTERNDGPEEQMPRLSARESAMFNPAPMAAFLMVLFLGGSVLSTAVNPDYYTFTSAMQDLLNGSCTAYAQENAQRLAILEDDTIADAVLQRYDIRPDLLYYEDVDPDPDNWANVNMAEYFGKDSVRGE